MSKKKKDDKKEKPGIIDYFIFGTFYSTGFAFVFMWLEGATMEVAWQAGWMLTLIIFAIRLFKSGGDENVSTQRKSS